MPRSAVCSIATEIFVKLSQIIHAYDGIILYTVSIILGAKRPTGSGAGELNAAYFLIPKSQVTYLYEDFTFRQGLEKMLYHDYKAIPVLTRDGRYVGTVTEGDFLWKILNKDALRSVPARNLEKLRIIDILRTDYPPVRITVSMRDLLEAAANQSFVPVEDDERTFIGIITRRDIIRYFAGESATEKQGITLESRYTEQERGRE